MVVALGIVAAVLAVVAVALYVRGNKANERAAATEAARARVAAGREELRGKVARLEGELSSAREEATTYRPLVEEAADWVWETDAEGVITFTNAAGAALLGRDDLVGQSVKELTHPHDRDAVTAGFSGVVRPRHPHGPYRTLQPPAGPGP